MKAIFVLALFFTGIFLATQEAQEAQSEFEKTIRYESESSVKPALKFWLDLEGRSKRTVSSNHVFQSGDRTKFYVESNADGYLYVAHLGSDGSKVLLFPSVDAGRENRIKAHEKKMMPRTGFFRFDNQAGKERIAIILSKERIPVLEALAAKRLSAQAAAGKDTSKSLMAQEMTAEEGAEMEAAVEEQSKTIVYDSGEASYQSAIQPGFKKPLVVNFTLKHQ